MKATLFSLLVSFSSLSFPAFAQDKSTTAVADAVEQLRKAMIDPDDKTLDKLVADKLSYGHSSGQVDDKRIFIDKLVSGQSDFVSIDISEQTISITDKTAIVRHILKARTNDNGKPGEVNLRILLVWQKQNGEWKLLARQALRVTP